jgi:hypothetical protein
VAAIEELKLLTVKWELDIEAIRTWRSPTSTKVSTLFDRVFFRYQSFGGIPMQTKTVAGYDEKRFASTPFGTRFVTQAPLLGSSASVLFF